MRSHVAKITAALIALTLAWSPGSYARDVSMVTVDWQPYYGSGLLDDGVITDVVREAFRRGGHNASVEYIPWTRALKTVEAGEHDIVMGAYYNDERAKTYHMSDPFYSVLLGLVSRRDLGITRYNTLEDLRPYRIGVSRGYANSEEFDAADYLNKDIAKGPTINLQKLLRKRIDMLVAAFGIFRYELNQSGGDVSEFTFIEPPLAENSLYIMASRAIPDGAQIIADFNRGLREIQADGTYDKLLAKHGF
ncbi:MAG: transporter substrate-binding domain-containing protein [Pseudomonadota bacterium]